MTDIFIESESDILDPLNGFFSSHISRVHSSEAKKQDFDLHLLIILDRLTTLFALYD